ncbi:MAG: hypothetical protein HY720_29250, partial [Planctomycetes bacterium]|nr:hypothetical protein [Planctomycetota bacterium]
ALGVRLSGVAVLAAFWWLGPRAEFASEIAGHRAHEAAQEGRAAARGGDIESAREALERAASECDAALATSPWEAYRTLVLRRERVHLLLELAALPDSPERRRRVARDAYRAAQALGGEDGLAPDWALSELDLALCAFAMGNQDRARQHVAAGWRARPLQWRYYDFYLANLDRPDLSAVRADLAENLARGLAIAPDSFPLVAVLGLLSAREGKASAAATLERAEGLGEAAVAGPLTRDRKDDYLELLARVREARPRSRP